MNVSATRAARRSISSRECEVDVVEEVGREQVAQVARAEAFDESAVVGGGEEGAAADDGEVGITPRPDGHREAVEAGVAAVVGALAGRARAAVGFAAVGVAEVAVRGRRLQRLADRVVVRDGESRRLRPVNEQQREARFLRQHGLRLLPSGRQAMLLSARGRAL